MGTLNDVEVTRTETRLPGGRFYSRARIAFMLLSVNGADILQQPDESIQLIPSKIRHRAIHEIPRPPERQVIPIARGALRQAALIRGPTEHVDDVGAISVDHYRGASMIKII